MQRWPRQLRCTGIDRHADARRCAIAFFKDTSLVIAIGLFDLLGAAKAVMVDAKWVGFGVEVYLFTALVYFVFCYGVSQYSRTLEISKTL